MVRFCVSHARVCKAFVLAILCQLQQALAIHLPELSHTPQQHLEKTAGTSERGFTQQGIIRTQVFNDGKTSLVESSLFPASKDLSHGRSVAQQTKFARHTLKAAVVMDSSGEIEKPPGGDQWTSADAALEQVNEIVPIPSLTEASLVASAMRHAPTAVILGSSGEATMVKPSIANPKLELDELMPSGAKIASFVTPSAAIGAMPATGGFGEFSASAAVSATGTHGMPAILSVPVAPAMPAVPAAPVAPATAVAPAAAVPAVPAAAAAPAAAAVPAVAPTAATAAASAATAAPAVTAAPAATVAPAAPAAAAASVAPVASVVGAPPGAPASATDTKAHGRSLLPIALVFVLVFLVALASVALIEIKRRRQVARNNSLQAGPGHLGGNQRHGSYRPRKSASPDAESHSSFKKSSYRARVDAHSHQNASSGGDKESPRSLLHSGSGVAGQSVPLGSWEKPSRKSKGEKASALMAPAATSSTNVGAASASPSLYRDRIKSKGTNSTTLHHDFKSAGLSSEQGSAPELSPEGPSRPLKPTTTVERDEEGDYLI